MHYTVVKTVTQLSLILDWFGGFLQCLVFWQNLGLTCMKQFKLTQLHFGINWWSLFNIIRGYDGHGNCYFSSQFHYFIYRTYI